ncbi:MAG TPA: DUF721 domain-containing protein [Pyrinomonadaceae bacterium]|nr:DUF721 domain-containing protein [Pyrinomonadaceae bacterium]
MDSLIKSLPAIISAAGNSHEVAETACKVAWKSAVGDTLSTHALPIELIDQKLTIAVADEIWQRQLEAMRPQLLFRLNSVLGTSLVKLIEIRVAPGLFKVRNPTIKPNKTHGDVPFELLAAASDIQDTALRRAFLGAAVSCIQRLEK